MSSAAVVELPPPSRAGPRRGGRWPPRPPVNKWLVTVSITFGTLMGTIDSSIVNVAMPHLSRLARRHRRGDHLGHHRLRRRQRHRHAADRVPRPALRPEARLHVLPLRSSSSARHAVRHRALARRCSSLFRVLQGFGAGALQPTEQAILRQTFPPEEQGMAMALFGMAVMIGPAVGPTLGGYIVDNYTWPWIFYINLPVGHPRPVHGPDVRPRARGHPRRPTSPPPRSSARTSTGRASRCSRSASPRCSTCSKRAPQRLVPGRDSSSRPAPSSP